VTSFNICKGDKHEKSMRTGVHVVRDISCKGCSQYLGWTYVRDRQQEYAYVHTEKYKEDKFIVERAYVEEVRICEQEDNDD